MVYKKFNKKERIKKAFWFSLVLLFLLLMYFMISSSSNFGSIGQKLDFSNDFSEGWTLELEDSSETRIINLPEYKLENLEGNKLRISKVIPVDKLKEPTLVFSSSQQHVTVYLDDEEIYEYETLRDSRGNKTNGSGKIIIDLPEDCFGKTLSIEYNTSFKKLSGFVSSIYYGEKTENTLYLLRVSLNKLILVYILFIMCIICAVFAFRLRKFNKRKAKGILSMSITLLAIIICIVVNSEWLFLLPNNYGVNYYIEFAASYSIAIFFYYYIYCMCDMQYDYIIKGISKFHFLLLVIFTLLQYLGICDFYSLNKVYLNILFLTLILSASILMINLRKYSFIKRYILIILMMILFTLSEIYIVINLNLSIAKNTITASIVIMTINLIYNFFSSYFDIYNSKIENEYLQRLVKKQICHYNGMHEDYKNIKKYRHDMKNHLLCINHLINSGEYKDALSYIENIDKHLSKNNDIFETNNPILDAILTEKKRTAKRLGIDFKHNIIINEDIKIEPVDLCIIFGNALDNAIESCEKVSKVYKEIEISMISKNNMLVVKIKNSMEGNLILSNNKILTSKLNKKEHGIGIDNIKEAIKKYDGIMNISSKDDMFVLQFTLFKV